jgi:hypothetical protein
MINYYKLKVCYVKIDNDSKSFTQITNAEDASSIGVYTNERAFTGMSKIISDNTNQEWLVISEEDFTFAKQEVLTKL